MEWKGCYIRHENGRLSVGNELFERVYRLDESGLYAQSLSDKFGNCIWDREQYAGACLYSVQTGAKIHFESEQLANDVGLTSRIAFEYPNVQSEIVLPVRAGLPFYTMRTSGGCSYA